MPVKSTTNIFAALQRKKKQPVKDSDIVEEIPQNGTDRHDEIEKAIFSSSSGFGDWAEEPEAGDWGASVPAEEESEEGWNQAKQGARIPSAIRQALNPEQHSAQAEERDDNLVEDVLADIDVEAELGIELARTDDEEESEAEEEPLEQGAKQDSIDKTKELKKESKPNLSKKEAQEMKKKELEDLDAMLAEFGVDTKQANGKEETATESSKAAKRRAKKERQAHANGTKSDDGKSQSSSDQQDSLEPTGPAIDPGALKSRKAAAKKKNAKKGGSAAAAAIAEAQAKARKNATKDKTKYNEFPTR